jgi:uncharacterized protein (DUF697 family)
MATDKKKIHAIIHSASVTAGGIGAGLAQVPGSDMPVLITLQTAMIVAIGHEHGCEITKSHAKSLLLTLPAGYGGRAISQFLIGWVPGFGNAVNATTAATITETIGWAADAYFEKSSSKTNKGDQEQTN